MSKNTFTYAGVSCSTYGGVIEAPPTYHIPSRSVTKASVVGRSGDLVIDYKAYSNTTAEFDIFVPKTGVDSCVYNLLSPTGYNTLTDSYDNTVYRKAIYAGPVDIENILNKYGRATIVFDCKPQRYLVSGDTSVTITESGYTFTNSYMESLPLIVVNGSGDITLNVGNNTVTIDDLASSITLDAEVQDCYNGSTNLNSTVTIAGQFPTLPHGNTTITWSGSVTSVVVTPRWWKL